MFIFSFLECPLRTILKMGSFIRFVGIIWTSNVPKYSFNISLITFSRPRLIYSNYLPTVFQYFNSLISSSFIFGILLRLLLASFSFSSFTRFNFVSINVENNTRRLVSRLIFVLLMIYLYQCPYKEIS